MENKKYLSDFYDFQYGKGNNNPDNGGQYPVYGSNGIIGWYDKYNSEDAPVIGHIGANCGSVVWASGKHFVTYNGVICNAKPNVNKRFAYYSLLNAHLEKRTRGAAQPFVSYDLLNKVSVYAPVLPIQNKIASILSTYDTLIENNTKRIRLLEKMAENLYKEWFVRFRFPGHEKVEMENGLPKGWSRGSLSEICEFKRGKNITSSKMVEGSIPVISAGLEPSGFHNEANVKGVSVTMSSSGANAGYIAVHYSDIWAADCSYIEESTTPYIYYVYELLNNIRGVISNFQRGAAQPHVYPKDINRIKLIVTSEDLMRLANERLSVMHKLIHKFQQQNTLLARQRDLLLPRLMSGKLEV